MTTKSLIHYVFRHSIGMVVMVVDGALTDTGKEEEFLIRGGSWNATEEGVGGRTKTEHQFYVKAGISL